MRISGRRISSRRVVNTLATRRTDRVHGGLRRRMRQFACDGYPFGGRGWSDFWLPSQPRTLRSSQYVRGIGLTSGSDAHPVAQRSEAPVARCDRSFKPWRSELGGTQGMATVQRTSRLRVTRHPRAGRFHSFAEQIHRPHLRITPRPISSIRTAPLWCGLRLLPRFPSTPTRYV